MVSKTPYRTASYHDRWAARTTILAHCLRGRRSLLLRANQTSRLGERLALAADRLFRRVLVCTDVVVAPAIGVAVQEARQACRQPSHFVGRHRAWGGAFACRDEEACPCSLREQPIAALQVSCVKVFIEPDDNPSRIVNTRK